MGEGCGRRHRPGTGRSRPRSTAFPGKVVLVRRPDRRRGVTVIRATAGEHGGTVVRQELDSLDELPGADLERGDPIAGPIVLVCAHGRRDACCARLGAAALRRADAASSRPSGSGSAPISAGTDSRRTCSCSRTGSSSGGSRSSGRARSSSCSTSGRIPLDLYRGRTIYPPPVQAAEILVRSVTGCDGLADLRLARPTRATCVTFATPAGELTARVEQRPGPPCPRAAAPTRSRRSTWVASLESAA